MPPRRVRTLLEGGSFFESPRWRDGRWWVSDFYRCTVSEVDPSGRARDVLTVEGSPSGLGWLPDGSLLVVSMRDRQILRWSDGALAVHADVGELCGGDLNDMVVDRLGRAYAGNFGFDIGAGADPAPAALVRVDPDGRAHVAADGLEFPNGMVITPDGRTLIVGETAAGRYSAFTIEPDGTLRDRRVWAQVGPVPTRATLAGTIAQLQLGPDGCTLDAEGYIWSADVLGGRWVRLAPGGEIVEEIPAPEDLDAVACMLGGDDGRTLLLCATPDALEGDPGRRDSVLVTTTVEVPHAGLP